MEDTTIFTKKFLHPTTMLSVETGTRNELLVWLFVANRDIHVCLSTIRKVICSPLWHSRLFTSVLELEIEQFRIIIAKW